MELHTALIVVHAVSATGALLIGIPALWVPRLLGAQLTLVLVMTASLGGAVVIDLATGVPGRWVFVGLLALALAMCLSSFRAARWMTSRPAVGTQALGFSLISLVTGFVAVSVIGAGWPVVVVTAAIAAPILIGRALVDRLVSTRGATPAPVRRVRAA